jgi:hypothetical protein
VAQHGSHVLRGAQGAGAQVTAGCLHQDTTGALGSQLRRLTALHEHTAQQAQQGRPDAAPGAAAAGPEPPQQEASSGGSGGGGGGGMYCGLCRAEGQLEVFHLPSWQRVFQYRNLGEAPGILENGGTAPTDAPDGGCTF